MPRRDWHRWIGEFVNAESEIHSGTAGVADERFYGSVRRFVGAKNAPTAIRAVVDFYHGLAAWDYAEAARAGELLLADKKAGRSWIKSRL